jgi:hypothetical protein
MNPTPSIHYPHASSGEISHDFNPSTALGNHSCSTRWEYPPTSGERVKKSIAMSFLFQRPDQLSSPTSPHFKRTSLHHLGSMASTSLKIRTPEEAGMSMHLSAAPLAVLLNRRPAASIVLKKNL